MFLKKSVLLALMVTLLASCQTTIYTGSIGQGIQTQVELSEDNFKVLGSFSGKASARKVVLNLNNSQGVVAEAKKDLLANAKKAGVELTGSRALVNVTTDVIQNANRLVCVMTAEIIEFED